MGLEARQLDNTGEMDMEQAAAYCKISPKTLSNKIHDGQGPRRIKRFGRLYFLASDLDKWIEQNTIVQKAYSK